MSLNVFQKWLLDFLNVPFALVSLLPPVEHCHSKQSRSPHTHRGPLQGSYLCCVMLWSQSRIKPRQPPSPLLLLAYISVRERERIKKRKKKGRKCPGGQGKTTKQPKQLGARRHTPVSWKPLATKHDANSLKVTVKDSSKRRVRKKKTKKKKTTRFPGVANFGNAIVSWSPATPSFYQISPRGFPLPNGRHLTLAASLSKSITCSSFTLPVVKSCSTNLATILGRPRDGGKTNHPNSILVRTTENMVYRDWKILVWKEIRKNIGGKKKRNRRYTLCCFLTIALMLFTCLKIPVTGL